MLKIYQNKLMYIKLEKRDWNGNWRGFCHAIKTLSGVTFNPAELDEDGWWFIPAPHIPKVNEMYYNFIGKVLKDADADRAAGFKPIVQSRSFARKRLRF